jgi:hypothetical protein
MWKPSLGSGILIVLSGTLALVSVACSNKNSVSTSSQSLPAVPTSPALTVSNPPELPSQPAAPSPLSQLSTESELYSLALDKAIAAVTLSESATCRDDWLLVSSQWKEAINSLKAIPTSSRNYDRAVKLLDQYQRKLAYAEKQAEISPKVAPSPKINLPTTKSPDYSVPITR